MRAYVRTSRMHACTRNACLRPQVNVSDVRLILCTPQIPRLLRVYDAYEFTARVSSSTKIRGDPPVVVFADSLGTNQEHTARKMEIAQIARRLIYRLSPD